MLDTRATPLPADSPAESLVAGGITDEELTALALAADPDAPPAYDARPDPLLLDHGPLPLAYMPPSMPGRHRPWVSVVAVLVISALVFITMMGFCITYGALSFA